MLLHRPSPSMEGRSFPSSGSSRSKRPRIDATDEINLSPKTAATTTSSSTSVSIEEGEAAEDKWRYQQQHTTVCDTSAALRMMCAQFPLIDKLRLRPFVLRSQLYSTLKDRTQVDRDLQSLKMHKVIRLFKLNTGQDDHAVMFMDDYLSQIETTKKGLAIRNKDKMEVFDWFKSYVIDSKLDVSIEHGDLCLLLSLGGKVIDEHVSILINSGFLTRQLIDSNMYWFAIPNIGTVLKGLSQGRKEIISLLERKKFKEMPLVSLEKKRLRLSSLDMRFLLRDLIGSGHLKTYHTPVGIVVRISKD